MNHWYQLELNDWRKYEQPGDKYLPFRQYIRKFTQTQFEYPIPFLHGESQWTSPDGNPPPPTFCERSWIPSDIHPQGGRGIVICGGGRFLPGIWVTVNLLRQFGCKLPIELWHLGADELPEIYRTLLGPMGVQFVDAYDVRNVHPCAKLGGWQSKPYAVILSRFEEVLFLDGDNHPTKDPTYLYDMPEYQKTGAVFWPDRIGYPQNATTWDVWGITPRELIQHETGQILINKRKCWHALQIAMHANQFCDFHYRHSWGDTATYQFALLSLNQAYHTIPHRLIEIPIDRLVETLEILKTTPYMRDPGDIRACFLQRDHTGEIIFQHRSGGGGAQAAFTLGENKHIQHFAHEELCLSLLADLRKAMGDPFWPIAEATYPDRISPHRRNGMAALFKLMEERKSKAIVETGTIRRENNWHGDGGMTWWFGRYAAKRDAKLTTVDIDPQALEVAKKICAEDAERIEFISSDSVAYLKARDIPIDVLYLDSLDYDVDAKRSQAHAMNEVFAALPRLHEKSIIAFDDCGFADGGKGGLVIPYLCASGWQLTHRDYVSVLIRNG